MSPWDVEYTLTLVHKQFGHEQRASVEPSLRALRTRIGFAHFHTAEIVRRFNASDQNILRGEDFLAVQFDEERTDQHSDAQNAIAAHAMAAAESLHSVADLLASAVLRALNLSPLGTVPFLSEADVTYERVLAFARTLPTCRRVAPAMHALKSESSFQYLESRKLEILYH